MANEEQLEILYKGIEEWNQWRRANPSTRVILDEVNFSITDFREVDLHNAFLGYAVFGSANLSKADLSSAYLREAFLEGSNLSGTFLHGAELYEAFLSRTNLSGADLTSALLWRTDLSEANLREAKLNFANFRGTNVSKCNFDKVQVGGTNFADLDLSEAIGLENIIHESPSTLGINTIAKSKGKIPDIFLRGCGLSDLDIEYAKLSNPDLGNEEINKILYKLYDLRASQAIQISPLFISYSHADSTFVDKLESLLNKKGVRFWRDIHDMKSGRMEKQIDRAMHLNPTVLLILSDHSQKSDWVEHEVRTARKLEKEMKRDILCPVAVDDSWKNSPWAKRIMEQVMEYNILDFSEWKDDTKFESTFNKLIDGLELFYK